VGGACGKVQKGQRRGGEIGEETEERAELRFTALLLLIESTNRGFRLAVSLGEI